MKRFWYLRPWLKSHLKFSMIGQVVKMTFKYRCLLNRGDHMDRFDCNIIVIPSRTNLRRDIVTLPSVFLPSFRNILQWILTNLGKYLVVKRIWNMIDLQGLRSRPPGVKFYCITSMWPLYNLVGITMILQSNLSMWSPLLSRHLYLKVIFTTCPIIENFKCDFNHGRRYQKRLIGSKTK
jgi:hypothetical protein